MSSIDTTLPLLAVLLITVAGVSALPWTQREVAESVRAFRTVGGLVRSLVGWWARSPWGRLAPSGSSS